MFQILYLPKFENIQQVNLLGQQLKLHDIEIKDIWHLLNKDCSQIMLLRGHSKPTWTQFWLFLTHQPTPGGQLP